MKANVIRLFEHVKLLQRGVELFQKQRGQSCDSLRDGFNGENVRIGLLGATSAGKTTLIKRLLSESAGKISSKPETACLVVHRFSKSENLKLEFRPIVQFENESIGREFNQFLKDFQLHDYYEKRGLTEWRPKEGITEEAREYDRDAIFSFFEQVNKFGEVFSKITWNHKQRRSDYNLTDLIDIYDLPGFGGKEEHDKAVSSIFEKEQFDVLIYLIDTSCGIPSKEEMGYLTAVKKHLEAHPETSFYWAYEKPLSSEIDLDEMRQQIDAAVTEGGVDKIVEVAKGLLDFTGPDGGDDDELRSRLLVDVLKPYFSEIGQKYQREIGAALGAASNGRKSFLNKIFNEDDSWPLVDSILGWIQDEAKKKIKVGNSLKRKDARLFVTKILLDEDDGLSRAGDPTSKIASKDREYATKLVRHRVEHSIERLLDGLFSPLTRKMSLTAVPSFQRRVFDRKEERDLHILMFDLQMYWMLKDREGVSGFIKRPVTDSLYDNIDQEVKAIDAFSVEDD